MIHQSFSSPKFHHAKVIPCVPDHVCNKPDRGGCDINARCIQTGTNTHKCKCLNNYKGNGYYCEDANKCSYLNGGCSKNAMLV